MCQFSPLCCANSAVFASYVLSQPLRTPFSLFLEPVLYHKPFRVLAQSLRSLIKMQSRKTKCVQLKDTRCIVAINSSIQTFKKSAGHVLP